MPWTNPETFTAGQTLTAASMNVISGNLNALTGARRLGYQTRSTDYAVNQTTIAAASNVFTNNITFTADGTSVYWVEFYAPRFLPASTSTVVSINLVNSSGTGIANIGTYTGGNQVCVYVKAPYIPAAGSTTINLRGVYTAATATLSAGSGGTGIFDFGNAWMAVYGPEVTT
jgi:hypothetical protein